MTKQNLWLLINTLILTVVAMGFIVINDAVVDHNKAAVVGVMWMGVRFTHAPVCCPACMPHAELGLF